VWIFGGEEYGVVRGDNAWLENKKLKAALQQAAEIVAKNYCPANYDCPLEDSNNECTQERAEKCWMDYWMGEVSNV
jgi:hypothetical protein